MKIQVLTSASARLWFAALSARVPPAGDLHRVAALLEPGLLRPHMRIVVERQNRPFGRLAAQVKDGVIRFWNAEFQNKAPADDMQAAMRLMIRHLAAARDEAGLAQLVIENRPGDDLPHNDHWLRALRQEGFRETCAYKAYSLSFDRVKKLNREPDGLSIHEIDATREQSLIALYRGVKTQTFERRHVFLDRPEGAVEISKTIGRGYHRSTWLMACPDGAPVGYALANLSDEPGFEGLSAWLVDIGCLPEWRRKGIASALLGEIVRRLKSAGAQRLLAAIDEVNVPSIGLHLSLGFEPQQDRHYIYQLAP